LPSAGEAVLTAQHAVDLLRFEARELFWRGPSAIEAQRRGFTRSGLIPAEAAAGVFGI